MSKINKSLDYNKLLQQQAAGKLLKKVLKFPLYAQIKWDGNYTVTRVLGDEITHYTSGGLTYTHTDIGGHIFKGVEDGYYIAERCGGLGLLGDRVLCNLHGPKSNQKSTNHFYRVFDYLTIDEYESGKSTRPYKERYNTLTFSSGINSDSVVGFVVIDTKEQLEDYLKFVVGIGYEGLMLIDPEFLWEDTKSRKISLCKYKKRPTADLLCIGTLGGTGKYEGMVGSLVLEDSEGRRVHAGSGLEDSDRGKDRDYFIGKVVEIEYEQILDTYIQPTIVTIREDKTEKEID